MESTTRKIKWTLKDVTEDKLKQRDGENLLFSSNFQITFGGNFYEWYFSIYIEDEELKFYLMFDPEYTKFLTITCKIKMGEDLKDDFTVDSKTDWRENSSGYGWNLISLKDLMNPDENYIDEKKDLVFNVELTLQKMAKRQQTNVTPLARESYAEFLDDDESSDASFTCSDGVKVQVHRVLLMKKSAEFKKIFTSMKQQHKTTRKLSNIDSVTMKEILKFAYTGNADLKDIQLVKKIYKASNAYDIPELQLQCVDSLSNQINIDNVLDIFDIANEFKLDELTEKCLTVIKKFRHQVMSSESDEWENLRLELKEKIFQGFNGISCADIELQTTL